MSLLLLSHWRFLHRHPLQTALAVLGITIGVSVVIAVDLTNSSAQRSFELAFDQISGTTTHRLVGGSNGVSEDAYYRLRTRVLPHFAGVSATPVIQTYISPLQQPQKLIQLLAIDPLAEGPFRDYSALDLSIGNAPDADLTTLMLDSNAVLLDAATAMDLGVEIGDQLGIAIRGTTRHLNIIGLIGSAANSRFTNLAVMDIGNAQPLTDRVGSFDHIDLRIPEHLVPALEHRLREALPAALRLQSTDSEKQSTLAMTGAFRMNLQALSLLALLVGMFLIYNTMNGFVIQRRQLFARLRTLGVLPARIFGAVLSEALLLGIASTLLGIPLGYWLADLLLNLATQAINDHYYVTTVSRLHFSAPVMLKGCALGLLATVIAAWAPAYSASREAPVTQLQQHAERRYHHSLALQMLVIGLLCVACWVLTIYPSSGVHGGFLAIFFMLLAAALLTPGLLIAVLFLLNTLLVRRAPLAMVMAWRDTAGNLTRTGVAAMALMVAVASSNGIGVMIESFRGTLSLWLQARISADIYVRPQRTSRLDQQQYLPADTVALLQRHTDIRALSLLTDFPVHPGGMHAGGVSIDLTAMDLPAAGRDGYQFRSRQPDVWQAFAAGKLLVSEPLANRLKLSIADRLTLFTDRGPHEFEIAGIYYDYGSEHGRALLHTQQAAKFWHYGGVESVGIYLHTGHSGDDRRRLLAELETGLNSPVPLSIASSRDIRDMAMTIFDRTFAITEGLRVLVLAVAMVGIFGALTSLQLERQRITATLRALGFTSAQTALQLMLQAALLGLLVGLVAIPVGQALAWMLINVVNPRAFGWSMALQPQWLLCFQNLLLAIAAAVAASLYPAWRSASTFNAGSLSRE